MTRRLADKTALVTGGNAGIGAAIARRFASEGAGLALLARRADLGEALVEELREAGAEAEFIRCDVTDAAQVATAVDRAMAWAERIDVVVNNAGGVTYFKPFPEDGDDDWQGTIALNLHAPFYVCRRVWPHLRASGGGSIVNVSSLSAFAGVGASQLELMGAQPPAAYSAGKAGLEGLSVYLAGLGGAHGIRVNCIRPGRILTEEYRDMLGEEGIFWPFYRQIQLLKRHGGPDDVAQAAVYLASDESSFVTAEVLDVNGGAIGKV